MKTRIVSLFLLLAGVAVAATPEIEFTGVMRSGSTTKLALRATGTGVSRWLDLGETFFEHTLVSYDAKDESVMVSKDNRAFRLPLVQAITQAAPGSEEDQEIRRLKEAILRSPNSGQLELQLGSVYRDRGRTREAFEHFLRAVRKGNLDRPAAAYQLIAYTGYELEEYGETLKAIDTLERTDEGKKDSQLAQLKRAIQSAMEQRKARAR